jgi:hypothetical protein
MLNFVIDPQAAQVITPVVENLREVALAQVLEAMLQGTKLNFVLADNVIYISTKEGCAAYAQYVAPAIPEAQARGIQKMLNSKLKAFSMPAGSALPDATRVLKLLLKDLTINIDPAMLRAVELKQNLDLRDVPLNVVLKNILLPNGLEYTIVGDGIFIREKAPATGNAAPPPTSVESQLPNSPASPGVDRTGESGSAEKHENKVQYDGRLVEIPLAALDELLKAEKVTLKEQRVSQKPVVGEGDATYLYAVLTPAKAQTFVKQMLAESGLSIIAARRILAFAGQAAFLDIDTTIGTVVSGYRPTVSADGGIFIVPTLSRYTKDGSSWSVVSSLKDGAIECNLELHLAEQIGSVRVEKPAVESPVVYQQSLSLTCTVENKGTILVVPPLPWRLLDNLPDKQRLVVMMLTVSANPNPAEKPKE